MAHTPTAPKDLVSLIVAALNGATVNGGILKATANGNEVQVTCHNDAPGTYPAQYAVYVH